MLHAALALAVSGLIVVILGTPQAQPARAAAGINKTINFQGRLLTAAGAVVPDGSYNMRFRLYQDGPGNVAGDTGGTLKWTEVWENQYSEGVTVKNGYFSLALGTHCAFDGSACTDGQTQTNTAVDWNQDTLWVSMDVGGTTAGVPTYDGEMLPMKRLSSTVYALQANNADQLGTIAAANYLQFGTGNLQADSSTNSSIYFNKTAAGNLIRLQSSGADAFIVDNSGNLQFGANGSHTIAVAAQTANAAGDSLTLQAGAGGGGATGVAGGRLTLQGGNAAGTTGNANGGDIYVYGGNGVNSGSPGNVVLAYNGSSAVGSVGIGKLPTAGVALDVNGTADVSSTLTVAAGGAAITGNSSVTGTGSSSPAFSISPGTASNTGLVVKAVSAQTANLLSVQDSNGNALWYVDANGNLTNVGTITTYGTLQQPTGQSATLVTGGSLTLSQTYYYSVTATSAQGESRQTTSVNATPTVSGTQSVQVSWTQVTGATGYRIYRSTSATFTSPTLLATISNGSTVSYTDTGGAVSSGAPPSVPSYDPLQVQNDSGGYGFKINSWGNTNVSNGLSVSGQINSGTTATNLEVTQSSGTRGALIQGYNGSSSNALEFQDRYGALLGGFSSAADYNSYGTSNSYLDLATPAFTTASSGSAYYYVITATNAQGETVASASLGMANDTSSLTWSQVTGATGYKIYRNTSNSFTAGSLLAKTITTGGTLAWTDTAAATAAGLPPSAPAGTGLTIQGWSGQTGNLLQAQDSSGSNIFAVGATGVLTLKGGNTPDITTLSGATATSLDIQPGSTSAASTRSAMLTLQGGNATGTSSNGGWLDLEGGSGTSNPGGVEIGAYTNGNVQIGTDFLSQTQSINIGDNANGATTITIGSNSNNGTTVSVEGGNTSYGAIDLYTATGGAVAINQFATTEIGNTSQSLAVAGNSTVLIGDTTQSGSVSTINIGSLQSTSATTLQAGTGNITLQTNNSAASIIAKSLTNSTGAFTVENSSAQPLLNVDTSGNNVNIGATGSLAVTTTTNIGTSTGAAQNVNVGSGNAASTTTLQGGTGGISLLTGNTASGTTGTVTIQSGDASSGTAGNVNIDTGASSATTTAGNLENDTFETGTDSYTGWINSTVAQSTAQYHGGTHSLAVTTSTGNTDWGVSGGTYSVVAGESYTFSAWVYSVTGDTITMQVQWGSTFPTVSTVTAATGGWTHLTGTAVAPAGATTEQLFISNGAASPNSTLVAYIDDVTVNGSTSSPVVSVGATNAAGVIIGNGNEVGSTILQGGTSKQTIASSGNIVQSTTNSSTAFQVQDAGSSVLFNADTVNERISVGNIGTATGQLYVAGNVASSILSTTATNGNVADIKVVGNYAYALSNAAGALTVYDISNPASPTARGVQTTTSGYTDNYLAVSGKYAYVSEVNGTSYKIEVIDISNPYTLSSVTTLTLTGSPQGLYVRGKYLYAALSSSNTLDVINISNPAAPVVAGSVSVTAGTAPQDVYVQGRFAYVTSYSTAGFQIFDVSNPASPSSVGTLTTGLGKPYNVFVRGRYAYITNNDTGTAPHQTMQIIDVSNPSAPSVTGTSTVLGTNPAGISVQGRYAYVTTYNGDTFTTLDISNPASPTVIGTPLNVGAYNPVNLTVQGRYAYIADAGASKLQIVDLGGEYAQQLQVGAAESSSLTVDANARVGGDIAINGAITAASGAQINGDLGITGTASVTATSTTALLVQDASSVTVLTVDTSNKELVIGSASANANPVLLVVNNYNQSSDPSGTNGAIYYNSSLGQFRCYNNGTWYNCLGVSGDYQRHYPFYSTDFFGASNAYQQSPWAGKAISSGTAADDTTAATSDHPGVVKMYGSTTSGGGYMYLFNGSGNGSVYLTGGETYDLVFYPANLTNASYRMGFFDAADATSTPTDGAYVDVDSTGTLTGHTASSSVLSSTTSTYTVSISTWYRLKIAVNSAGTQVDYYLYDDSGTVLWHDSLTTNIPTAPTTCGVIASAANTGGEHTISLDYMDFYETRKLTR